LRVYSLLLQVHCWYLILQVSTRLWVIPLHCRCLRHSTWRRLDFWRIIRIQKKTILMRSCRLRCRRYYD